VAAKQVIASAIHNFVVPLLQLLQPALLLLILMKYTILLIRLTNVIYYLFTQMRELEALQEQQLQAQALHDGHPLLERRLQMQQALHRQ
jgi:uncharacterized membrane protein (DUF106 family)